MSCSVDIPVLQHRASTRVAKDRAGIGRYREGMMSAAQNPADLETKVKEYTYAAQKK